MFPIHGVDGRPVAFIGRAAPAVGVAVPKYLSTRDTVIYRKGRVLYGTPEQATWLGAGWTPVLVEGPLDVLAVWLAHRDGAGPGRVALAICGSVLTAHHVATVCGLSGVAQHGVMTCFDQDAAGLDATVRAWRLLPTTMGRPALGAHSRGPASDQVCARHSSRPPSGPASRPAPPCRWPGAGGAGPRRVVGQPSTDASGGPGPVCRRADARRGEPGCRRDP
jgi:hypothetical protein